MTAFRGPQAWMSRWRRNPLARWRRNPLWRWRRNPLRRRSDVLEAWVMLAAWTVTVLCGVLTGLAAAHSVEQGLARERAEWHPVRALVAEDAPEPSAAASSGADRAWAKVRWTTANGSTHSGQARVAAGSTTGTPVTVWTDRDGLLVTKPVPPSEARVRGVTVGLLVGVSAAAGPFVGGRLVRGRLERRRMEQWDEGWARFGPMWGRKTG
ncbi:Rv1733c family protein [Streptomyces avermitilis]|uniref:Rv1733c family protein n=1 Tax=Streptomyces avermitilis TaxID=33903 RepID=UPI00340606C2